MRKLITWRDVEDRIKLFIGAAESFASWEKLEDLSLDGSLGWESFREYFINTNADQLLDLVCLQTSNKPWVPRAERFLLVTPNTGRTTGIVALFWAYMSGAEYIGVRPGKDDTWMGKFLQCLSEKDSQVQLHDFPHLKMSALEREISQYDVIVVYGSQHTIDLFRLSALNAEVISYGPKMSIALHDEQEGLFDLNGYFSDVASYDGLGCLNTSILYTLHWNEYIRKSIEKLASKLEEVAATNPVVVQNWQFESSIRSDFVEMWGPVVRRHPIAVGVIPLPTGFGTLNVVKIDSEEQLLNEWKGRESSLSSATLMTGPTSLSHWTSVLSECGASRVVFPGEAQSPVLSWENGGCNPLRSLVRVITTEGWL